MSNNEVRNIPSGRLEIRKSATGKRTLYGIAAPFNSLSQDLGGFRERIQPGAFRENLRSNPDVRLSADHDMSVGKILARTSAGTMNLREGDSGLELEASLPDTSFADDIAESINRGDVDGLSISFNVDDDGDDWQDTSDGVVRSLRSVSLGPEISIVALHIGRLLSLCGHVLMVSAHCCSPMMQFLPSSWLSAGCTKQGFHNS